MFHNTLKLRAFVVKMCITFVHLTIRTLLHVMVNSLRSLLAQCTAGSRNRFEDDAMKKTQETVLSLARRFLRWHVWPLVVPVPT